MGHKDDISHECKDISGQSIKVLNKCSMSLTVVCFNTLWCGAFLWGKHDMGRSTQSFTHGNKSRKKTSKEKWPKSVLPSLPSPRQSVDTLKHMNKEELYPYRMRTHTQPKSLHHVTQRCAYLLTLDRQKNERLSHLERGSVKGKVITIGFNKKLFFCIRAKDHRVEL